MLLFFKYKSALTFAVLYGPAGVLIKGHFFFLFTVPLRLNTDNNSNYYVMRH